MVLVVVVGVGEDGLPFFEKAANEIRPPPEVLVALLLEMRMTLREFSPVAEPADVREAGRRLLHPGHPRVVDERQGGAARAASREIGAEPASVAHLDGVAEALRQTFQEVFEDAHTLNVEGRRKLKEEGTEPSPSSAIVRTKFSASASAPTRFLSCVTSCGNFAAKRKPSGTISRHFSTVERRGVP